MQLFSVVGKPKNKNLIFSTKLHVWQQLQGGEEGKGAVSSEGEIDFRHIRRIRRSSSRFVAVARR